MKPSTRKFGVATAVAAVAILSIAVLDGPVGPAFSQQSSIVGQTLAGTGQMPDMTQMHQQMLMQSNGQEAGQMDLTLPTMPGQDAFGAIQEIVRILEADPNTDWSKVDLEALRQHLIDMNEVTLKASATAKPVDGGLAMAITGDDSVRGAIQRMVPAHAQELNQMNGWSAKAEPLPNGVLLTVTSSDPKEVAHIRGLGFIGLLVSGSHHQPHHLAMAKSEMLHQQ